MPKVLRTTRIGEVAYPVGDGGLIWFNSSEGTSQVLVLDDNQANELLANFPNEIKEVPEKEWSKLHKDKVAEYKKMRLMEATKLFPDIIKEKVKE